MLFLGLGFLIEPVMELLLALFRYMYMYMGLMRAVD
jgi:hypothetical protein